MKLKNNNNALFISFLKRSLNVVGHSLFVGGQSTLCKYTIQLKHNKLTFTSPQIGHLSAIGHDEEHAEASVSSIVLESSGTIGIVGTSDGSISSILHSNYAPISYSL